MPFNNAVINSEILAVHGAMIPGGAAGRVLLFGGDEHNPANQESASTNGWKKTRVFDVATRTILSDPIPSPDTDVFCAGHAFLPDGRLLIGGGTSSWSEGADDHAGHDGLHHGHPLSFGGHRRCWIYNPSENEWLEASPMLPQPGKDTGGGRWYPTLLTLGTGEVIAFFGHPLFEDDRHRNTIAEKYRSTLNGWVGLPQMADPYPFPGGNIRHLMYPRAFLVPDGRVFFATGMPVDSEISYRSTFYDPSSGDYVGPAIAEPADYGSGWSYPAVLLPLLPREDYRARVLFAGNVTPRRIDLDDASPSWPETAARSGSVADRRRTNSLATILPTGQVCVTGGVHVVGRFSPVDPSQDIPEEPVLRTEIYDPGIDWSTGEYTGTEAWSTDEDDAQHARNYHSIALLLPDGTVLTAGGNTNASSGNPNDDVTVDGVTKKRGKRNIEIYEPAYVAAGGRPNLSGAPAVISYGQEFPVTSPQAAAIERVALIRFGSVTHGHDYDQRYVGCRFNTDGTQLTITAPPSGNVAPPGFYQLWIVDDQDRPCQQAAIVRLASVDCDLVLDRSTFGVFEVEALLTVATPAVVPNAVYAVFDGFRPSELGSPPMPPGTALRFADDNSAVPIGQMRLRHRETLLEDPAASADVVQRVTFVYDVEFGSTDIFGPITEQRVVRADVTHGAHRCTANLVLVNQPNPYMRDISATDENPHWLSIDLRVFQVAEGETVDLGSAGSVTQGSGGTAPRALLAELLNRLGDNAGAFDSALSTDIATSTLELARFVDGKRVYNYAVAQVRYRALTEDATNVQMFFRLFTTGGTNVRYDPATSYRRTGDWPNSTPLLGTVGGELVSIPCFAEPRVPTAAGGVSLTTQMDPLNRRSIEAGGASEVTEYFGAWLDINQTTPRFPQLPGDSDGPFFGDTPLTRPRPIQELVRGVHQCLVAELRFQPGTEDPIPGQAGPGQSDRLAQRNLMVVESDNPGSAGSRTVAHTFELSASTYSPPGYPVGAPLGLLRLVGQGAAPQGMAVTHGRRFPWPDELLFRWGTIPRGSEVEVSFADLDLDEVLRLAATRMGPPVLRKVDGSTLGITVGEATWVPIPGPQKGNVAALLAVRLPEGIKEGQHFSASVAQVSGSSRTVIGTWQLSVPVSKASNLRAAEVRRLSVLKHIASTIPPASRWHPIFQRYLNFIAARVRAYGNDPDLVHGNPNGTGMIWQPEHDGDRTDLADPCCPRLERWLRAIAVVGVIGVLILLALLITS